VPIQKSTLAGTIFIIYQVDLIALSILLFYLDILAHED
jgi:hypothetical protein